MGRGQPLFIFTAKDNKSAEVNNVYLNTKEMLRIPGFAIDSYTFGPSQSKFCEEKLNLEFKKAFQGCRGNLVLRNLTEEEKAELQQYGEEEASKLIY